MNYQDFISLFHEKMKEIYIFIFIILLSTIINNFVGGFLFDNLKIFSELIQTKEKPRIIFISDNNKVLAGESLFISCISTGNPVPDIQWYVDRMPIVRIMKSNSESISRFQNRYLSMNFKMKKIAKSTLIFKKVLLEDNNNLLTCESENVMGTDSQTTKIRVFKHEMSVNFPMVSLEDSSKSTLKRENSAATIKCQYHNSLNAKVYWFRNYEFINEPEYEITLDKSVSKFSIKNIMRKDEGTYHCFVTGHSGGQISKPIKIIISDIPPPTTNVTVTERTSTSSVICWKLPFNNLTIEQFVLHYESREQIESVSIPFEKILNDFNGWQCYTLKKLHPFTTYRIWINSLNSLGKSQVGKSVKFNTSEDLPQGPPTSITASAISNTAVEVRWKSVEKINGILKKYILLWTEHSDLPHQHWRQYDAKSESSLISHLTPNRIHYITIQAVNNVGKGPLSKPVAILTKSGTISECPEFRASKILLKSIVLEWNDPDPTKTLNCFGLNLEISYKSPLYSMENKIVNITTNQFSFEIHNVKEDTEIVFTLRAFNQVGFGMPVKLLIVSAGKAKINKNVVDIIGCTSFTIVARWRQPNKDAKNMTLQLFEKNGKSFTLIVYRTLPIIRSEFQIDEWKIYNFTRLKPSQKYQIRLTFLVVGEFNEIRESFYLSNVIETKKAHPQSVGNFNLKTGVNLKGHPNVMAEWEEIPIFDKVFSSAIYHLKYRIIFPAELSTKFRSIYTNKSSHVIQLLELPKYGVTYEFVLARYGNVSEKLSVKKLIAMPEGKPSESPSVIKVIYMSERKVTLKWKNPHIKFRNGKLIYNEVQIIPLNQILNSTDNTISFYKLPNKVYQLRVRSCTRVACGPWSKYFEFSVYDVEILPPKEIRAFRVMDTKIRVEWSIGYDQNRMPYVFSKNLLGFVIYYSTRDTLNVTSAWSQIKIYDNISRYEIKNIEKKFFYIVRMSSIDQYNRTGKWSEPSVPENVDLSSYSIKTFSNLQCYQTTSNSIELRADYPVDNTFLNSILVTYSGRIIFWSPLNPESVEFVSEKEISLDYNKKETIFKLNLKDLNVNTKYIIRIFPIYSTNSKFDSNITLSTNTHCDTKPIAPVLVLPPKIVQISTFFIILQLMRTDERNGRIDYYHLIVVPYMSKSKMVFEEYNKSSHEFSLIELKTNAKQNKLILPILALSRKPIQLFGNQPHYDFLFTYNFTKPNKMDRFSDGNFYRSALRACVETDEGHFLCNTSDWSESFQINFILQDELKVQNSKNTEKILKPKHNDKAVITLSLTLSGITLAIVGIIIGCVVHKRKLPSKKWENSCRSSTPKIQQDAQMTPLVDLDTPKLDQEPYYLRTDQNYGFDTNNEVINYKNYINSSVTINNYDSPILKNTTVSANHQNTTPDIVNVSDRFNFFNNDSVQVSSNVLKSRYTIPIDKLAEYINDLKSYDYLNMMQEFEELNKETLEKYSSINSNLPQNKMKNRYANITAYDHSIVPLQNPMDRDHCNYINANYIDGYGKQNEYIATQGPLAETAYEFWQMVWEQKSTIIVMLVRNEETESKKCEIYWPKKGTRIYYDIEVTLVSFISRAYYTIRKFQIKQNGFSTKRQVYQLQFTGWPDQGIPILFLPFLSFLKIYKKFSKSDSGPTIVHCSAGVGRTGVFIVVDSQMERIKHDRTVNIYDQIKAIRKQRNFMVQTEAQYGFIYDVLLEWNQGNYSEIVPDMLISQIKSKSQIVENNSLSGFEIEFQKLNLQSTTINANMSRIHGNATVNKQKNNSPHLIPFDWNRVALSSMSGVDGSDYINASYIDSYMKTKAYIVSQDPMASTVEDFWRLVWDQNCSIIVVLGKIEEFMKELSLPYWPVQKSIRYQFFVVDPMVEYNMSNYIMREFKVTDARDGEFKTVRQFHYSKWLNNICPCDAHSFLEFIHQVQLTKENFGHGNPLLVHCSYGTGKSGIFIALNNILEKLNQESLIDVYDTVKLLQQQRVGLVQTVDQYKFCYLSILTHMIDINPDFKAQFCGFKEYLNISNKKTTTAVNE